VLFTGPVKRRTRHPSQALADITGAKLILPPTQTAKIALTMKRKFGALLLCHLARMCRFFSDPETIGA
jgi:hypothetical protein